MTVIPETQTAFPVLYILMRSDMDSMNAGKAMAQASHASNAFVNQMKAAADIVLVERFSPMIKLFDEWQSTTPQGFGTVLVLEVNETQMRTAAAVAESAGFVSGVVHDPTYPIRDGEICHFLPIDTCAYVFGDKNDALLAAIVGNFPLHP